MRSGMADEGDLQERLAVLVRGAQHRWGSRALRYGAAIQPGCSHTPSGFAALDRLLGGGLTGSALTELLGAPTSGTATLALHTMAQSQQRGRIAVVLDLAGTFDAAYAHACGVELDQLLIAHPHDLQTTLDLLMALADHPSVGMILLDSWMRSSLSQADQRRLVHCLPALNRALLRSQAALVVVTAGRFHTHDQCVSPFQLHAALRLHFTPGPWLMVEPTQLQRQVQVTICKQYGMLPGRSVTLAIPFPDPGARL